MEKMESINRQFLKLMKKKETTAYTYFANGKTVGDEANRILIGVHRFNQIEQERLKKLKHKKI